MKLVKLTDEECLNIKGGEITITAIMALMCIAIASIVCFKLFFGSKSKVVLPGGFTFQWE